VGVFKTYAVEKKLFKVNHYTIVIMLKDGLGECSDEGTAEYVEIRSKKVQSALIFSNGRVKLFLLPQTRVRLA
jgi:hypothetical protein